MGNWSVKNLRKRVFFLKMASVPSTHLQWMVIRNNSCFLKKGSKHTFSTEKNNLKNRNSFRFNGLVHDKTVGVEPCADGKGVVLVTRNAKKTRVPAKSYQRAELKKGARQTLTSVRKVIGRGKYRRDLKWAAMRRASALMASQKPVVPKFNRRSKKE